MLKSGFWFNGSTSQKARTIMNCLSAFVGIIAVVVLAHYSWYYNFSLENLIMDLYTM